MESRRDDLDLSLIAELLALRPAPRPEFAAELDARAAAGFPRRGHRTASISRIVERLRTTPKRRILAPAGAFALGAIAIATAVVATSEDGTVTSMAPQTRRTPIGKAFESGAAAAAPLKTHSGAESAGAVQFSEGLPRGADVQPRVLEPFAARSPALLARPRDIERSALIVLGTDPADVRADAAKVFDAVHAADGIVLSSSIRDGAAGDAGASFDLLIPSGKLGDALAAFSAIAGVRSRRETTRDITAPTIGAGERLADSQAKVDGLLAQLAGADTDAERAAVEAKLHAERRRAASLRSRLAILGRRANFPQVSLRIETGTPSAAEGSGDWGVSDGIDDAGHILAIATGVTAIGLAIVGPIALICLLAWLAYSLWVRARRKQALR